MNTSSNHSRSEASTGEPIILIIDDDPDSWAPLYATLSSYGTVAGASDVEDAMRQVPRAHLIFLDMMWGSQEAHGLEILDRLRPVAEEKNVPVYILTHAPDHPACTKAIERGAAGVFRKPKNSSETDDTIRTALKNRLVSLKQQTDGQLTRLKEAIQATFPGSSDSITQFRAKMFNLVRDLNREGAENRKLQVVLLVGETGTGKQFVADFLAAHGPWRATYMKVDVSTRAETLVEGELFGAEKGAYTDARQKRVGLIEQACGGTLFLDEIQEWNSTVQAKMKTFMEDGKFSAINGVEQSFYGLIVAATNQPLKALFKPDLLRRFGKGHILELPPLRRRTEDIKPLGLRILQLLSHEDSLPTCTLEDAAWTKLESAAYPGNTRDLHGLLKAARLNALRERSTTITAQFVNVAMNELALAFEDSRMAPDPSPSEKSDAVSNVSGRSKLEEQEERLVREALKLGKGNISAAARFLQTTRRIVELAIERHHIDVNHYSE